MSWPMVAIADLTESSQYGTSAKAGSAGAFPILRMGNITYDGRIDLADLKYIDLPTREVEKYTVRAGDILFNRTNSAELVGKTAVFRGAEPFAFAGYLVRLRTNSRADPHYVSAYLNSPRGKATLRTMAKSIVGMANINARELGSIRIPLPPVNEQRRVAAILDHAASLRKARHKAVEALDTLILSSFCQTFECSTSGPLVGLYSSAPRIPPGWTFERLTDVARLATGHTPSRRVAEYWNGDIPWLTLGDIRAVDGRTIGDTAEHVTALGIDHSSAVLLPADTVCFARTASVGFVTKLGRDMATSQDFVNWVCGPKLLANYLMWALIHARPHLLGLASGSTHRTIYFPTVEAFSVVVPPVEQQLRFSKLVDQAAIVRSAAHYAQAKLDALFASLQHRAFNGELTAKAVQRELAEAG